MNQDPFSAINSSLSRRRFLKVAAAAACVGPYVLTSRANEGALRPAASGRITMASIGIGNQGSGDIRALMGLPGVQMVAVCDVRKTARDKAKASVDAHYGTTDCRSYLDFREVLARDDIDAVHIATPDHWHAYMVIEACRRGKDVYIQKPESLTIREGRMMVEAARRYGRVVSGGSQRVLGDTGALAKRAWDGEFGTIRELYVNCGGAPWPCNLPAAPMDEEIDWDLWLGPAPWAPYHPKRCDGTYGITGAGWRSWSDYSGGGMTDWGAHRFGGALFIADMQREGPVEVLPPDGTDRLHLTFRFANGVKIYHAPGRGTVEVVGTPGERLAPRPMPHYKGPAASIFGDFLHCVRTRERPFRDIEFAHRTATICHLGNIAYALRRPLAWDPVKEIFPGDAQANRFLDRARREPWALG